MSVNSCVFDAYGTLFDVASAARQVAAEPGREAFAAAWPQIAEVWRLKQLQYSWLRAVTGAHTDFWAVTEDGLDYALAGAGFAEDPDLRRALLDLYRTLQAYPEVRAVLQALKAGGFRTAILSNGAPEMLAQAVASAEIGDVLDAVISVEEVGVFKPDRRVYDLVGAHFGVAPAEVLFVSSNGWDAAAATGYGFETAWVNRAGDPVDRLPWHPVHEVEDLSAIPKLARGD